jgi:hypothetical protein
MGTSLRFSAECGAPIEKSRVTSLCGGEGLRGGRYGLHLVLETFYVCKRLVTTACLLKRQSVPAQMVNWLAVDALQIPRFGWKSMVVWSTTSLTWRRCTQNSTQFSITVKA